MHAAQWCKSGKTTIAAIGFDTKDYDVVAVALAVKHYEEIDQEIEAGAITAAKTNSLLGMARVVQKFCK